MSIEKLSTNASLKQVMDKFEEISLTDLFSLNIIIRNELPSSGVEGQICIISDRQTNKVIMNVKEDVAPSEENRIFMLISPKSYYSSIEIGKGNKNISLYFLSCKQYVNGKEVSRDSYVFKNRSWELLTSSKFLLFEENKKDNYASNWDYPNMITNGKITLGGSGDSSMNLYITHNLIDLTNFNAVVFDTVCTRNTGTLTLTYSILDSSNRSIASTTYNNSFARQDVRLDVSKLTGQYKIRIQAQATAQGYPHYPYNVSVDTYNIWCE